MSFSQSDKIGLLVHNMKILSRILKMASANTRMIVAAQYTAAGEAADETAFRDMDQRLKKGAGWFSILSRDIRFCLDAMLLIDKKQTSGSAELLFDRYRKLVKSGFLRQQQTYIAAAMLAGAEENGLDAIIAKANEMYKLLKKRHFVLTNGGDVSLIILLAQLDAEAPVLIEREEYYFEGLQKYGFRRNNDLQTLACVLAFLSDQPSRSLIEKCAAVKNSIAANRIRLHSNCYPIYGMIALLQDEDQAVQEIANFYQAMREEKMSLFIDKDFYFQTAAHLCIGSRLQAEGQERAADPGIVSMTDLLIRAQEAAQAAAMAASASAVIAANSSGAN
ncbi:DUF4003 family protein [Sporolactobacillus sp. KGMB 08714]|uniref:DUF4003 family protein n=1 Tax=Sporolactobacillus sp. KGMB 08714 TaxID=3064704 RepID=UPI002FBECDFB